MHMFVRKIFNNRPQIYP